MEDKPGVGVAAVVTNNGRILLGRDKTKSDVYGVPGGHWENGESLSEALRREVREEAGIEIKDLQLISVYDFYREDKDRSYVTIGFRAAYDSGELQEEAGKRTDWDWYAPDDLPKPIFEADKVLIERFHTGTIWEQ